MEVKKKPASYWVRLIITAISLILISILIVRGRDQIVQSLNSISLGFFFLLMGFTLFSRIMVGLRWYFLLRGASIEISLTKAISITFMGLFASNFLPSTIGGDIVRLAAATRISKKPVPCTASLVMDRIVGIFGMLLVSPIGLYLIIKSGQFEITRAEFIRSALLAVSFKSIFRKGKEKAAGLLVEAKKVLSHWLRQPKYLFFSLLSTFGHMAFLFLSLTMLLDKLKNPVQFWVVAGLWSISYLITLIPISINGLGIQELSLTILFNQIGNVEYSAAAIMAVLIRVLQMLASLIGGFVLYFIFPDLLGEVKKSEKELDL